MPFCDRAVALVASRGSKPERLHSGGLSIQYVRYRLLQLGLVPVWVRNLWHVALSSQDNNDEGDRKKLKLVKQVKKKCLSYSLCVEAETCYKCERMHVESWFQSLIPRPGALCWRIRAGFLWTTSHRDSRSNQEERGEELDCLIPEFPSLSFWFFCKPIDNNLKLGRRYEC